MGKRLGVPPDRVFVNIQKYGNTSSASTMMAVHEARQQGLIQAGDVAGLLQTGDGQAGVEALVDAVHGYRPEGAA